MNDLNLANDVSERFKPFLSEILDRYPNKINSIHIIGSALTADYDAKRSDINSVFVLQQMDLKFLEVFAPLGMKYGKKKIAAPLMMTPDYIKNSLDVFPIEFLNIQLLHSTVFGEDVFKDLEIKKSDLRHQCERELKVKLIGLRQGYISASGDRKILTEGFVNSFAGYIPLFRGIIVLHDRQAPRDNSAVLTTVEEVTGVRTAVFRTVLRLKKEKSKPSIEELNPIFEDYYEAIEQLGELIDAIDV